MMQYKINLIKDLGEKAKDKVVVEKDKKKMLHKGRDKICLQDYLDSNPAFHNWSRSCDVGH